MLLAPKRLISPSGRRLEIQLETHVYTKEDSRKGFDALKDKEVVGIEGVQGLTMIEKFGLLVMYYVTLPLLSLFTFKKHAAENPTMIDTAVCSAINQGIEQPKDPERFQRDVCELQFDGAPPTLPNLKRVEELEGPLDFMERSALIFLELRFIPLLAVELASLLAIATRPRQVFRFLLQTGSELVRKGILKRKSWSVDPIRWPRYYTFFREKIGRPAATLFNPFAWHRIFWRNGIRNLTPGYRSVVDHLEAGLFYYWIVDQIILDRNERMAKATDAMVERPDGYRDHMIVVGMLHFGIARILVEEYGYRWDQEGREK